MALAVPVIQEAKSILDMDNNQRTTCELVTTTTLSSLPPSFTGRTSSNFLAVPSQNPDDWIQVRFLTQ